MSFVHHHRRETVFPKKSPPELLPWFNALHEFWRTIIMSLYERGKHPKQTNILEEKEGTQERKQG